MKRAQSILIALLLGFTPWAMADTLTLPQAPVLNTVRVQLHGQQWVQTNTAAVTVNINAAANDDDIVALREKVLSLLADLAKGAKWHVINFKRNADKTGLEQVHIQALARLDSSQLNGIRKRAQSMSKPGMQVVIGTINFSPSVAEMLAAKETLRQEIYHKAKSELEKLNKIYPQQSYQLHEINFITSPVNPRGFATLNLAAKKSTANIPVSNRLQMTALVTLAASMPAVHAQD